MTGPSGGMQGIAPQPLVERQKYGQSRAAMQLADGKIELGAVWIELKEKPAIQRLNTLE